MNLGLKSNYESFENFIDDVSVSVNEVLNLCQLQFNDQKTLDESNRLILHQITLKLNSIYKQLKEKQDIIYDDKYTILQDGKNDEIGLLFEVTDTNVHEFGNLIDYFESSLASFNLN